MILHYSLAILSTNDNALSLLFFANAPMSDSNYEKADDILDNFDGSEIELLRIMKVKIDENRKGKNL